MHRFVKRPRAASRHLPVRAPDVRGEVYWETAETAADQPTAGQDFAEIWQAANKVVYSRTLDGESTARTRIERDFDHEAVRQLKASAGQDIVSAVQPRGSGDQGPALVDELHLFLNPVVVGGGTRALPDDVRLDLELLDELRFAGGVVHLPLPHTDVN